MNTEKLEEVTGEVTEGIAHIDLINSVVIIFICFAIYKVISFLFLKSSGSIFRSKKSKSYIKMTRSVLRYVFTAITVLLLLQVNGVNVTSIFAGIGIMGIIIGFAIQDVLKDMIKGFDIITHDYFHVGDVVSYGNIWGKVLVIGLKTTKIEDLKTMNIVSVSNRNIELVEVVSKQLDIIVPMPYEVSVSDAEKAIDDILSAISKLEHTEKCSYCGVDELGASSVNYRLRIICSPEYRLQLRRDALRCVLSGLEQNGISVPYNQLDIHSK